MNEQLTDRASEDTTETPKSFAWLRDRKGRRSALLKVEKAVREGWNMDQSTRVALVKELAALVESGTLSGREVVRVSRIYLAMDAVNLGIA